jgi:hypothetical protein
MKNVKLPILGLSLVLLITSCKKDDFKEEALTDAPASVIGLDGADSVGWKTSGAWESADQETFSVRYFSIDDANITDDVVENGLVLLFKKNGTSVTEGSLLISCDVYEKTKAPGTENSFKYFVVTPEKLQTLEADGHTSEELMGLSYQKAVALLGEASH